MHTPWVAHPAVDATAARVDPQDVLEPKVLPQASVDDLIEARGAREEQVMVRRELARKQRQRRLAVRWSGMGDL